MSENQILEQDVLEQEVLEQDVLEQDVLEQDVLESIQTLPKIPLVPAVYANLLSKLRQHSNITSNTITDPIQDTNQNNNSQQQYSDDKNKRGFKPRQNGIKPRQSQQQSQSQSQSQSQQQSQQQQQQQYFQNNYRNQQSQQRLSPEAYLNELKNCQKTFFVHLAEYLKEEITIKSKSENDKKKESKEDKKKEYIVVKKTNLERIQGGNSVNVMKLFLNISDSTDQKYITGLGYLDNLVSNRQMNFFETLSNYMNKYNIVTSFRGKTNIMLHSPHLMV